MLIKYSLHAATYIRNLPFSSVLVFLIIIAFIPTRSTSNACYIKINEKQTRQIHATRQLITFHIFRLCSKTKRTVEDTVHFTFHF
jgi:hypothetical protein